MGYRVLCCLLLVVCAGCTPRQVSQDRAHSDEWRLQNIEARFLEFQETSKAREAELQESVRRLEGELVTVRQELGDTRTRAAELTAETAAMREALRARHVAAGGSAEDFSAPVPVRAGASGSGEARSSASGEAQVGTSGGPVAGVTAAAASGSGTGASSGGPVTDTSSGLASAPENGQTSGQAPGQTPGQTPGQVSGQASGHISERATVQAPEQATASAKAATDASGHAPQATASASATTGASGAQAGQGGAAPASAGAAVAAPVAAASAARTEPEQQVAMDIPALRGELSGAERRYEEGLSLVRAGEVDKGRRVLDSFIGDFPNHALVPNALYWMGETYYHEKRYAQAVLTFKEVVRRFPKHDKAAAAMLKVGFSYEKLGDNSNARFYLQTLVDEYPDSSPAQMARERVATL